MHKQNATCFVLELNNPVFGCNMSKPNKGKDICFGEKKLLFEVNQSWKEKQNHVSQAEAKLNVQK